MQDKYKSDLADIKDMMHRSSRFISLDGWSGIAVGLIALVGAFLAYRNLYADFPNLNYRPIQLAEGQLEQLLFIATGTLFLAIAAALFFTMRESKKQQQSLWDAQSKRLVLNLGIPLVTGGLLCIFFLYNGLIALLAPMTLIFHGLALVNASQYTLKQIRILGLLLLALGLAAMYFLNLGLIIWGIGFGLCHIGYGVIMKWK